MANATTTNLVSFLASNWQFILSSLVLGVAVLIWQIWSSRKDRESSESIARKEIQSKTLSETRDEIKRLVQKLNDTLLFEQEDNLAELKKIIQKIEGSKNGETVADIPTIKKESLLLVGELLTLTSKKIEAIRKQAGRVGDVFQEAAPYLGDEVLATKELAKELAVISLRLYATDMLVEQTSADITEEIYLANLKPVANERAAGRKLLKSIRESRETSDWAYKQIDEAQEALSHFSANFTTSLGEKYREVVNRIIKKMESDRNQGT